MTEPKRLYRNTQDAWIAGVGSGLAEYTGIDKTAVRVVIALIIVFTGLFPGAIAYLIMWAIIPPKPPATYMATTSPPP